MTCDVNKLNKCSVNVEFAVLINKYSEGNSNLGRDLERTEKGCQRTDINIKCRIQKNQIIEDMINFIS